MTDTREDRRSFLKTAGLLTVGAATVTTATGCHVDDPRAETTAVASERAERPRGFDRLLLDAVAATVLPMSLGDDGVQAATNAFVQWADEYDPVAEEMHGYGYADIRYLPADPAPAWRAQLSALDLLAQRTRQQPFAQLTPDHRRDVITAALRSERGDRLPSPLGARHIVLALLGHWASQPAAWDLALGVQVAPSTCRPLNDATRKPLPVVTTPAGARA
jgi:hypothetical protein